MALNRWELVKAHTSESQNRYVLKVDGSREDIVQLFKKYNRYCWVPYALPHDEYAWGVFVEDMSDEELEDLKNHLSDITHYKRIEEPDAEKEEKKSAKIEIIGSTWDWQQMQIDQGLSEPEQTSPPPEQTSIENKEKGNDETPIIQYAHDELSLIPERSVEEPPAVLKKEKVYGPEEVEINDIIAELNKILADFTEEKHDEPSIPQSSSTVQSIPSSESPVDIENSHVEKAVQSVNDHSSWDELTDMLDQSDTAEKEAEPLPPPPEETITHIPPEEIVVTPSNIPVPVPEELPVSSASEEIKKTSPVFDPSIIRMAILCDAEHADAEEQFVKSINDNLIKIAKDSLSSDIILKLSLNTTAFDPQTVFEHIDEHNVEIVFFIGFEHGSPYKLNQLISLLDTKNIAKKQVSLTQLNKQFIYLNIAAELLMLKKSHMRNR